MNFQPQLSQEDLAQMIDREGLAFEVRQPGEAKWTEAYPNRAQHWFAQEYKIRLAPGALTEFGLKPGMQPHDPDGLTADVITEGGKYRAMMKGEITNKDSMAWDKESQRWITMELINGLKLDDSQFMATSYRTAVSTPFPKADHIVEPTEMVAAPPSPKFKRGDRVTKISGGSWTGIVVGEYSTELTPEGYAVESENEPGSVQIYPAKALRLAPATEESSSAQSDTPRTDKLRWEEECNYEVLWEEECEKLERELTAALSQRDEARRLLAESREKLAALVAASDGVSIEGIDLQNTCETLKQITEYLK